MAYRSVQAHTATRYSLTLTQARHACSLAVSDSSQQHTADTRSDASKLCDWLQHTGTYNCLHTHIRVTQHHTTLLYQAHVLHSSYDTLSNTASKECLPLLTSMMSGAKAFTAGSTTLVKAADSSSSSKSSSSSNSSSDDQRSSNRQYMQPVLSTGSEMAAVVAVLQPAAKTSSDYKYLW
eukprot:3292-Heterococcus_DN1.PRE.3